MLHLLEMKKSRKQTESTCGITQKQQIDVIVITKQFVQLQATTCVKNNPKRIHSPNLQIHQKAIQIQSGFPRPLHHHQNMLNPLGMSPNLLEDDLPSKVHQKHPNIAKRLWIANLNTFPVRTEETKANQDNAVHGRVYHHIPGRTGSKWTILIVHSGVESGAAKNNKLGEFLTLAYLRLRSKLFVIES